MTYCAIRWIQHWLTGRKYRMRYVKDQWVLADAHKPWEFIVMAYLP